MKEDLVQIVINAIYDIHQFRDDCAIRALGSLIDITDMCADEHLIKQQTFKAYQYADAMLKAKFN